MGEAFERLFTYFGAAAWRQFGWWGLIVVVVLMVCFRLLLKLAEHVRARNEKAEMWLFSGLKGRSIVKLIAGSLVAAIVIGFLIFPSSPLTIVGFLFGVVALAVKFFRKGTSSLTLHYMFVIGTILCLGLTVGGMLHDVAFPPTALCSDGTYSSSSHHRGTCSWHGGVGQWNPDPWWEALFK
jgi:hypothetical protein